MIKSYTDIPQSKKLTEFLPIESADMQWFLEEDYGIVQIKEELQDWGGDCTIPCWSLAALFSILPDDCGIDKENGKYVASYIISDECGAYTKDNPIDAAFEMILKLHELKML